MAEIIRLADHRSNLGGAKASPEPMAADPIAQLERTPELALCLAIISALSPEARKEVLRATERIHADDPQGYGSLAARFVAARLVKGGL